MRREFIASLVLATAALSTTPGCGIAATVFVGVAVATQDSGSGTVTNVPAAAQIVSVPRGDPTTQPVTIKLADPEGDAAQVELSFDAGAGMQPATLLSVVRTSTGAQLASGAGETRTAPLPTSPAGEEYVLTWAWKQDTAGPARTNVPLRLAVVDAAGNPLGTPFSTTAAKVGNEAPGASNVTIEGDGGIVVVRFDLLDGTSDICAVAPRFRVNGGAAQDMTPAAIVGGRTDGLVASPAAQSFNFTWNTESEPALVSADARVVVVLAPADDAGLAGTEAASASPAAVNIDNNESPRALVGTPGRSTTGTVELAFTLVDPESDGGNSVAFRFQRLGDPAPTPIPAADLAGGLTGRGALAGGLGHTLSWNYEATLATAAAVGVRVEVVATDANGDESDVARSAFFVVGNTKPTVAIDAPAAASTQGPGVVTVQYRIFDTTSDLANVTVEFDDLTTPGEGFKTASSSSGVTALLTDPAAPIVQQFAWQSDAALDLPGRDAVPVTIRVRATDIPGGAASDFVEATFTVDNQGNLATSAQIVDAPRGDATSQPVAIRLTDAEGDPARVKLEYETSPGTFATATLTTVTTLPGGAVTPVVGPATPSITAGAAGTDHLLAWAWQADLGDGNPATPDARTNVKVRLSVVDAGGATIGAPLVATIAKVGNDAPRAHAVLIQGGGERVVVRFDLSDSTGDILSVVPTFSVAGGASGTIDPAAIVGGRTTGLVASPTAQSFDFTWDTSAQLGAIDAPVTVSITPTDDASATGAGASATERIDNNAAPRVRIRLADSETRSADGTLAVSYEVLDDEGDPATVLVAVIDAPNPVTLAAAHGTSPSTVDVPANAPRQFVWSYLANGYADDVPETVRLRLVPVDRDSAGTFPNDAGPADEIEVSIGNAGPTIASNPGLPTTAGGTINLPYKLTDASNDPTTVSVVFSLTADFATTTTATSASLREQLATPGDYIFAWDSAAPGQLPGADNVPVFLRLSAVDEFGAAATPLVVSLSVDNVGDVRPSAQFVAVPRGNTTIQPVQVRLSDPDGAPGGGPSSASLRLDFIPPGGVATATATLVGGATQTPPLLAPAGGQVYTLEWDWPANLTRAALDVPLSLVVLDAGNQVIGTPVGFTVAKVGNDAPVVSNVRIEGDSERVVVRYDITDTTGDVLSVVPKYETSDGGSGTVTMTAIVGGRTDGLVASPTGVTLTFDFTWDTRAQLGAIDALVTVTITPTDDAGATGAAASATRRIDNNATPRLQVFDHQARSASGTAIVRYRIFDAESDPATVEVGVLDIAPPVPGLVTPVTAVADASSDPLTGRSTAPTDPPGFNFVWNWLAGHGPSAVPFPSEPRTVKLALRARNDQGDVSEIEPVTILIGNAAPVVNGLALAPGASNGDVIELLFALTDSSGDRSDVAVTFEGSFETPVGPVVVTGTLATTSDLIGLSPGIHQLLWQSDALGQAGLANGDPVTLTARARDEFGALGAATSVTIIVDNVPNRPPSRMLTPPQRVPGGTSPTTAHLSPVRVPFSIQDPDGDPLAVTNPRFRVLPAGSLATPTGVILDEHGMVVTPAGLASGSYFFEWSFANVGTGSARVEFDLSVTDGIPGPIPPQPPAIVFEIGNDPPGLVPLPSGPAIEVLGSRRILVVRFSVRDPLGDDTRIVPTYTFDPDKGPNENGAIHPARVLGGVTSDSILTTTEAGTPYDFAWDTLTTTPPGGPNIGARNGFLTVHLQTVDVFGLAGVVASSAAVRIENDTAPVVLVSAVGFPNAPLRGRVPITFSVIDPESTFDANQAQAVVAITFERAGLGSARPATGLVIGSGDRQVSRGLSNVPVAATAAGATPVTFLWDTTADLGANFTGGDVVTVRITADTNGAVPEAPVVLTPRIANEVGFSDPVELETALFEVVDSMVADVDGDGATDCLLLTASGSNNGAIVVLRQEVDLFVLGQPNGSFLRVESNNLGSRPVRMATADFNGDGLLDVAVADNLGNVIIHFQLQSTAARGQAFFVPGPSTFASGAAVFALATLDADSNGFADLAIGQDGANQVKVVFNNGSGVLGSPTTIGTVGGRSILAADFDGDRIVDLAIGDRQRPLGGPDNLPLVIMNGTGSGSFGGFASVPYSPGADLLAALDIVGDLPPYLVTAAPGNFEALSVATDGTLADTRLDAPFPGTDPASLSLVDVTGDGRADAIVFDRDTKVVSVSGQQRQPTMTSVDAFNAIARLPPSDATHASAGDIDADGVPDIAVGGSDRADLVSGAGEVHLDAITAIQTPVDSVKDVASGDFDGDGIEDVVVVAPDTGRIGVGLGVGDGRFTAGSFATVVGAFLVAAADLDADGRDDVVLGCTPAGGGDHRIEVLRSTGVDFVQVENIVIAEPVVAIALNDLTGDGAIDIVALTQIPGPRIRVINQISAPFGEIDFDFANSFAVPGGGVLPTDVATGDVDLDGVPDVAVAYQFGRVEVYHRVLSPLFDLSLRTGGQLIGGGQVRAIAIADVTLDGIPDIVAAGSVVALLRGRGDGAFDVLSQGNRAGTTLAGGVAVADFTGDGLLDAVAGSSEDPFLELVRGRTDGRTATAAGRGRRGGGAKATLRTRAAAIGDRRGASFVVLDATPDGVPDLAVVSELDREVAILGTSHGRPSEEVDIVRMPSMIPLAAARAFPAQPLNPANAESALPPLAGMRLMPASLALTISPDNLQAGPGEAFLVTLPTLGELTADELNGLIHVFRHDRDVPGETDPPFRTPIVGRIAEVASNAVALPSGVTPATVLPFTSAGAFAGSVQFQTTRLGTFQVFVEVPAKRITLLRETFDELGAVDGSLAPLPEGWSAGHLWQVGPVSVGMDLPSEPATAPNVLGTVLRGPGIPPNATGHVTTPMILLGNPVFNFGGGPRAILRFKEWYRLPAGEARIAVINDQGSVVGTPIVVHGQGSSLPGDDFDGDDLDLTPFVEGLPRFQLRFTYQATVGGSGGRGWYLDDIDLSLELP